jgi:hypothetical protein
MFAAILHLRTLGPMISTGEQQIVRATIVRHTRNNRQCRAFSGTPPITASAPRSGLSAADLPDGTSTIVFFRIENRCTVADPRSAFSKQPDSDHRACGASFGTDDLLYQHICSFRRARQLWGELRRNVSSDGRLCRENSKRRKARRSASSGIVPCRETVRLRDAGGLTVESSRLRSTPTSTASFGSTRRTPSAVTA